MNFLPLVEVVRNFAKNYFAKISAETLGWLAVILFNCALVPTMLAIMTGHCRVPLGWLDHAVLPRHCAPRHAQHHHHWRGLYGASSADGLDIV
jgi:hypothetical protein